MKHTVKNWMTKNPFRIDKYESLGSARDLMRQEAVRHLLVFDHDQLRGVLSHHDLNFASEIGKRFKDQDSIPIKITVGDLMSRLPVTIFQGSTMKDALVLMKDRHFHCLPVVNEHSEVVGILSEDDILRYALVASQYAEADLIPENTGRVGNL